MTNTLDTLDTVVHSIALACPTGTSRTYELRAADPDTPLPTFEAGAHIDVHLGPTLIRQYSLLNSPQDSDRYLICVRRDDTGRGGSTAMHRDLTVGQRLRVSTPRNLFPLLPAERYVLVAGGIGITPLLSMAEELARRGADFALHHYATAAEAPLLERLQDAPFTDRVHLHDSGNGDSIRTGLPTDLSAPNPTALVYICGPDGFMRHVTEAATAAGWQPDQLHLERFAPAAREPDPATDGEFHVRVASTGDSYPVPAEMTIAEVLTANGVEVELSCEQGMCGACLTPVLAGEPDHRDEVQTDDERAANTHITICCSRARSAELVLGL
ncbi:PDR/VanB family oxidoreductase [Streptomyces sp. NPDC094038]|uniref:PDR/VanB family oxidoreductase n=1 Tax=Streptomyces sp. NPDC094038 TaxID=3366055 RepID=UPI0038055229